MCLRDCLLHIPPLAGEVGAWKVLRSRTMGGVEFLRTGDAAVPIRRGEWLVANSTDFAPIPPPYCPAWHAYLRHEDAEFIARCNRYLQSRLVSFDKWIVAECRLRQVVAHGMDGDIPAIAAREIFIS